MDDFPHLLFMEDIQKTLGHITRKTIGTVYPPHLKLIASYYYYAQGAIYNLDQGVIIWQRTVEAYFELIKLVADLGKIDEMSKIYFQAFFKINEGLQYLYHNDQQFKLLGSEDWRARINCLLEKYHILFEANVRFSIIMAIYCLDIISENNDAINRPINKYFEDDLSYHIKKIENCRHFNFQNELINLIVGLEPNMRHAIAHRHIEYGDEFNVILTNRNWKHEYKIGEIERINETTQLNYYGQITSMLLFLNEYKENIDFKVHKSYTNLKQLRILIDTEIRNSYLTPIDIRFQNNNFRIECDIEKQSGFDSPSEIFGGIRGVKFHTQRPALQLRQQIFRVVYFILRLNTEFKECQFNLFKFGKSLGSIRIDMNKLSKIEDKKIEEEIHKHILSDNLKDEFS